MNQQLYLSLRYDLKKDAFQVDSDIKPERRADVVEDFLRSQMGEGADPNPATEQDQYHIRLMLDLSDDTFRVEYDTGNKGLREGILMRYLEVLREQD